MPRRNDQVRVRPSGTKGHGTEVMAPQAETQSRPRTLGRNLQATAGAASRPKSLGEPRFAFVHSRNFIIYDGVGCSGHRLSSHHEVTSSAKNIVDECVKIHALIHRKFCLSHAVGLVWGLDKSEEALMIRCSKSQKMVK